MTERPCALALLAAMVSCGPALAADDNPMKHELSENQVIVLGVAAAAGAAWLAYNAGDDAEESQRNLVTIGAAYAVWGAALWINSSRTRELTLVPAGNGAMVGMQLRFGGVP